MSEISIKKESLPERCETCHQNDMFDADVNYCQRCAGQQKTNLKLVEPEAKPLLTPDAIRSKLVKNNSEFQIEYMARKIQIEQAKKDERETNFEKQRQQIREWRIKNRKAYRESMDIAFAYLNSEFSPQAFQKLSFEEKLVWSHVMKDEPKNHESGALCGLALFLFVSGFFFFGGYLDIVDIGDIVAIVCFQLFICIIAIMAIVAFFVVQWRYFNPWRDRRVFRFYRLYKKWNRKVNGQEIPFDPTIDYIQDCPDSPDIVKAFRCKKYPI